ncbi:MAG: glycosyltransferase family 4 protein [Myxococcales bacterium]|nr:glycosyltransferase family 4 protein [Myxococcales bacterium]
MRIGVVTTSYPRTPTDPAGSFVAAHVHALRTLGHDVDVIAAGTRAGHDVVRIPSTLFERGGAPDALERTPFALLGAAASFSTRLAAAVALRAHRWDSIVAHWLVPSAIAALPSRVPLLAIAHGGDVHTLRRMRLLGPVLHLLARRGAELVFVSEELRTLARTEVPRLEGWLARATVQPMGLDLGRFSAIAHEPTDPPTVVVAARLVPVKGVDVMIDAAAQLRSTVRVVIAGDGPARAELEHRARRSSITFLGQIDTTARDRLLGTASIVVVPSRVTATGRSEGTPMIALEALAAGVPLIASEVGGLRALAPAAHLVRPEDPAALARAIDHLLAAPPRPADLQAAVDHLGWDRIAHRLVRSA